MLLSITVAKLSKNSPTVALLKAEVLASNVGSGIRQDKCCRAEKLLNQSRPNGI